MFTPANLMRALLYFVSAATLVIGLGCESDQEEVAPSPTPVANLTQSEQGALRALAEQLRDQGILQPAVPLYLPAGLAHYPFQADGLTESATLVFGRSPESTTGAGPIAMNLDISQGTTGTTILLEPPFVDLDGIQASAQSPPPGDMMALYALTFRIDDRDFLVSVTWQSPDNELTEAMRQETHLVARSLIADFRHE